LAKYTTSFPERGDARECQAGRGDGGRQQFGCSHAFPLQGNKIGWFATGATASQNALIGQWSGRFSGAAAQKETTRMARLDGKVASSRRRGGIGAATGRLFCEEGARVCSPTWTPRHGAACAEIPRGAGAQLSEVIADVGSEDSARGSSPRRNAPTAASTFSSITRHPFLRTARRSEARDLERILAVNLLAMPI